MSVVLDASAVLAVLLEEPGAERVSAVMRGGTISAVNASEVAGRIVDRGYAADFAVKWLRDAEIAIVPFRDVDATQVAALRPATRHVGASFGDRACLALAQKLALPVLTADRRLAELDIGIDIRLVR